MALWIYERKPAQLPRLGPAHDFDIVLDIQPDVAVVNGETVELDRIKRRSDFEPISRMVFPLDDDGRVRVVDGRRCRFPCIREPFNLLAATAASRLQGPEYFTQQGILGAVQCVFSPEAMNFADALWLVTRSPTARLEANVAPEQVLPAGYKPVKGFAEKTWMPKPTLEGPASVAADGEIEITFRYRDRNKIPHSVDFIASLKATSGYLSHARLPISGGVATFRFVPIGLRPGDVATIKVGAGSASNIANHSIEVVAAPPRRRGLGQLIWGPREASAQGTG